jgi:hypothetical protein
MIDGAKVSVQATDSMPPSAVNMMKTRPMTTIDVVLVDAGHVTTTCADPQAAPT